LDKREKKQFDAIMALAATIPAEKRLLRDLHVRNLESLLERADRAEWDDFLDQASDPELLHFLSEASLSGPFSLEYYKIYMSLFRKTFENVVEIPEDIRRDGATLDSYHLGLLSRLRRSVRAGQTKALKGVCQ
jgi:hypothetical protein